MRLTISSKLTLDVYAHAYQTYVTPNVETGK